MNRPGFRFLVVGGGFALLVSTAFTVTTGGDSASTS
jgi:hypothetical protein